MTSNDRTKPRKPRILSPPSSSLDTLPLPQTLIPKMGRKSILKSTVLTVLFVFGLYGLFTNFFNPINPYNSRLDLSLPLDSSSKSLSLLSMDSRENFSKFPRNFAPVKVHMYDLPRKFTYGVIESYAVARGGLEKVPVDDVSELKYPGNQHSGEWYLFADLIREDRDERFVVRVSDPEEADLFYVSFFSSLSLVVNPIRPANGKDPETVYNDEEMQESLLEWLEQQKYWKRNNGRDHVFIAQDPNALHRIVDRVKNGMLLVSDFGRLRSDTASLIKDVIVPYAHRIKPYTGPIGVDDRKSLLFFMGNRYRKEGGKIRNLLFEILEAEKDVIIKHGAQSRESRRMASQGMHSSKFCLHPAGDTPSACRLFDAIVSLCIPVIVSDQIELPFEDVIDYRKFSVFVDSTSAVKPGFLVNMLRKITRDTILEYQREMQEVKRYFVYEDKNGTVGEIWRQVSMKLPLIKLMINRDKRLVSRELTEPDCSCLCSNQSTIRTIS